MALLSDVALAIQLHAEVKADDPEVTIIHRQGGSNRRRTAYGELSNRQEWRRGRWIKNGGFGQVYLEECISGSTVGRVRAVKKLMKARSENYHHELNALALFSLGKYRDNFVQCFGWYATEQHIYLAMEFLPHGDLQQHLDNCLTEPEARLVTIQVLEALEYMHERHFTHRDLKPGNILISQPGPNWWIKVADFGISKRTEEGLTSLRTAMGTQEFAAPEVILSDHKSAYTNAVDIWGAGMVALLMLVGMPNMNFKSILRFAVGIEKALPDQTLITQPVTSDARSFLQTLLQRDASDRPSAVECLNHSWLRQTDHTIKAAESARKKESPPIPSKNANLRTVSSIHRSTHSDTAVHQLHQPGAAYSVGLTAYSTGSLMPTAQWSTNQSELGQGFTAIQRPVSATSATKSESTLHDSGIQKDFHSDPSALATALQYQAETDSEHYEHDEDGTLPDTPIALRISVDKKLRKLDMPLKHLRTHTLTAKVSAAISIMRSKKWSLITH